MIVHWCCMVCCSTCIYWWR